MSIESTRGTSRRNFIKTTGQAAAASVLAATVARTAHAAGSDLIQVALIGCGGRGSEAARNALHTKSGPIKLVAMADAYEDRLKGSHKGILNDVGEKLMDVPPERQFIGFEAYKQAIDCLKPGDVAIFATPLAFRWVHFGYAIEKGINVFMEKPLTADGPTSRRMLDLAEKATAKNLKVGVGLMSRHASNLEELHARIQDGDIGDIICMRGYRMQGAVGHAFTTPKDKRPGMSELDLQVRRFHSFHWAGGGAFSDFNIHIIDHLCWMKNDWPIKAQGVGGRHFQKDKEGNPFIDQNFDSYGIEYTFADGAKLLFDGRCMNGAEPLYGSFVHGTKGIAIASKSGDCGGPSSIYKGQALDKLDNRLWVSNDKQGGPYDREWEALIDAIRNDKPYNEVKRGVEASLVTSMGRVAAHTGRTITYEQMIKSDIEYAPGVDKLTKDSPAPLTADKDGFYPQPMPGLKKWEY